MAVCKFYIVNAPYQKNKIKVEFKKLLRLYLLAIYVASTVFMFLKVVSRDECCSPSQRGDKGRRVMSRDVCTYGKTYCGWKTSI